MAKTAAPTKASLKSNSKGKAKPKTQPRSTASIGKKAKAQKAKSPSANAAKKKRRRIYTEKELALPKLNMITPAGVKIPSGRKKGKVFVDDQQSMMTILAMVNADKEGQIESKVAKARQMEEIRQARQKEMEVKQQQRKNKLEVTKDSLRAGQRKGSRSDDSTFEIAQEQTSTTNKSKSGRKKVSFE